MGSFWPKCLSMCVVSLVDEYGVFPERSVSFSVKLLRRFSSFSKWRNFELNVKFSGSTVGSVLVTLGSADLLAENVVIEVG